MIAASQLNCISTAAECGGTGKSEEATGLFDKLLTTTSDSDTSPKTEVGICAGKPDGHSEDSERTDASEENLTAIAFLLGWNQTCSAGAEMQPSPHGNEGILEPASGDIADIFEGKNLKDDMDIGLLTKMLGEEQAVSGEEAENTARMPIMELLKDSNASIEADTSSYLCPLENTSEQTKTKLSVVPEQKEVMEQSGKAVAGDGTNLPAEAGSVFPPASGSPVPVSEGVSARQIISGPDAEARDAESLETDARVESSAAEGIVSVTDAASANGQEDAEEGQSEPADSAGEPPGVGAGKIAESDLGSTVFPQAGRAEELEIARNAAAEALGELAETISSLKQEEKQFEIQLEPEHLGKLTIILSKGEDGITAQIRTGDANVQSALASQLSQLMDKLGESGIRVEHVDVICADLSQQQSDSHPSGNSDTEPRQAEWIPAWSEESAISAVDSFFIYSDLDAYENSVEYRV